MIIVLFLFHPTSNHKKLLALFAITN